MALVIQDRPLLEQSWRKMARELESRLSDRPRLPPWVGAKYVPRSVRRQMRRGALVCPDVGEVIGLVRYLYGSTANTTLKLFKTNVTPGESDTHSSYTVADFTNYVDKTLTASQSGSTWSAAATSGGTTSSTYGGGTPQSWTCGVSGNTVYGYWWQNATPVLLIAEAFASSRTLAGGDTLNLTPYLEFA